MHKYHKSSFSPISLFIGLLQHYDLKFSENSYHRHFSAQVSQIVFLACLTVLRLFTTVWPKMSENSYLRHFSAQVSQIVFLIYLKILRLITTVWTEMWENSYLCHLSAQVSQSVFLGLFDRFTTFYNCMTWNFRKLISPPFQRTSITNRVFRLFHPLMAYYNIMTLNFLKTHISAISVHQYHKSCS